MRVAVVATAICLSIVGLAGAQGAKAAIRMPTNIPAQGLGPALKTFAQERNLQVLYFSQTVRGMKTGGASGELTVDEALTQLLSGTGLVYRYVDDKAVTILAAGAKDQALPATSDDLNGEKAASKEGKKSSSGGFRPDQVDQGTNSQSAPIGSNASTFQATSSDVKLEEIVVTAQKREERLQDVPVPVTAINGESLVEANQVRLQDYYTRIPGLSFTPDAAGQPTLVIRGLTTGLGNGNPTVAVTVDDVPYGSFSGNDVPDIDPGQLSRVEVLRGPQGTLYGASSLGGLIKFVTVDPSSDAVTGRIEAGISSVQNGAELGYNIRGSVNIPLSNTWAVSASGFTRRDPGYIDDPGLGREGVNVEDAYGGRLSLLWRASQDLSVKLGALIENNELRGSPDRYALPGLGYLQQSDVVPNVGGYVDRIQAYSAVVNDKIGDIDLTSVTGYNVKNLMTSIDASCVNRTDAIDSSCVFGSFTAMQFGVEGTPEIIKTDDKKLSQEFRLSMPLGSRFDWLFGVFYTYEKVDPYENDLNAVNPSSGATVGHWFQNTGKSSYAEKAAFTDLTLHVTDRFNIQFGGRESQNRQTYSETDVGPYYTFFGGPSEVVALPEVHTKDNSFTYLITPQFRISPDVMVYARVASGYRAGGPNAGCIDFDVPCAFKPDKTKNYEVGAKAFLLDRTLSVDGSVYYIDWKDIQISEYNKTNFQYYIANAAGAKSQGVELSIEWKPTHGLTIATWASWNDAVLTDNFPANSFAYGVSGNRLPNSSRISGSLSIEDEFPIADRLTGFVSGTENYVGNRLGPFQGSSSAASERQYLAGYARADFRGGVRYDTWKISVYVNNLGDAHGLLTTGPFAYQYNYIQPRTIGISATKAFE